MLSYSPNKKPALYFLIFTLIIISISWLVIKYLNEWKRDIISGKKVLAEVVAGKLETASAAYIESLYREGYFGERQPTKKELDSIDARLKKIISEELKTIPGMEGGVYLEPFDEFYGYAFPTSPPPEPVYGPPPRSYGIIKKQALQTVKTGKSLTDLHSFDPAVFPLATIPLKIEGFIPGAVWARIHIERDLPSIHLEEILKFAAIFFLIGFIVTLFTTFSYQKKMKRLSAGLQRLDSDSGYRLKNMTGIFGFIVDSINKLLDRLQKTYEQKQFLEKELYQQDKLATLGKLIAGVAHEVKTPLAIIKTRIQIWQHELNKGKDSAEIMSKESMDLILKEIDRITQLVKRLLVFSKPISENFSAVYLNKILNQTISLIQIEKEDSINLETELDDSLPTVYADPNALEQVILNIVTNSIEASGSDGTVTVKSFADADGKYVNIEISDNGPGIPEEIRDKLFDPFFTTKNNGVGLGLSISYEIIKAHKGKIFFRENNPAGAVFVIQLPTGKRV